MDTSEIRPNGSTQEPNGDAAERKRVYKTVQTAIQSGDMMQAHQLLLTRITVDGNKQEFWQLLAWTSPSRVEANELYDHLMHLFPDNPLALRDAAWSGIAWNEETGVLLPDVEEADKPEETESEEANSVVRYWPEVIPEPITVNDQLVFEPSTESGAIADQVEDQRHQAQEPESMPLPEESIPFESPFREDRDESKRIGWIGFPAVLVLYLASITGAEIMITQGNSLLGLIIHGVLLVVTFLYAIIEARINKKRLLLALMLAPAIRVMSLLALLLPVKPIYGYVIIGVPLLLIAYFVYRLSGFRSHQVGLVFGKSLPLQLLIGLTGLLFGYIEFQILLPEPLVPTLNLADIWLPALILLVFPAFLEELIFRGVMQRASISTLKKFTPWFISFIFAVLHLSDRSWVSLVAMFLIGLAFSYIVELTRSLLGVTLAHGLANICLFLIFPFIVTGQLHIPGFAALPPANSVGPAMWSIQVNAAPAMILIPSIEESSTATLLPPTSTWAVQPDISVTAAFTPSTTPTMVKTGALGNSPTSVIALHPTSATTTTASPTWTATRTSLPTARNTPTPTRTPTEIPADTPTLTATVVLTPTATLDPSITVVPTDVPPDEPTPTIVSTDEPPNEPSPTP